MLAITAKDHNYALPKRVRSGWVTIDLKNAGQAPHHAQLVRLNDGVSEAQFEATLKTDPQAMLSLVTLAGGPGVVDPGGSQRVTVYLEPGRYFVLCFVPDDKGTSHLAHGMIAPLDVVAGDGVAIGEPTADAEVQMLDFAFVVPTAPKAGKQTWKIAAAGKQPHEMGLVKLAEGKTSADVQAWLHQPAGPPPFSNAGGLQALDPGEAGYVHLDLTPGAYIALCHVPDPASGKAHLELGMLQAFTVR